MNGVGQFPQLAPLKLCILSCLFTFAMKVAAHRIPHAHSTHLLLQVHIVSSKPSSGFEPESSAYRADALPVELWWLFSCPLLLAHRSRHLVFGTATEDFFHELAVVAITNRISIPMFKFCLAGHWLVLSQKQKPLRVSWWRGRVVFFPAVFAG